MDKAQSTKTIILSDRVIKKLKQINHRISSILLDIHSKKDKLHIKFSYIDLTTDNSMLSYLSTNKEVDFTTQKELSEHEKWNISVRTSIRIGALIRTILIAKNITFIDKDIEDFTNLFIHLSDINYKFELIKGDDIKKWYYRDSYASGVPGSSLLNSCMRYKSCGNFLSVYTKNPSVSMLACINKENKLLARAIVWYDIYIDGKKNVLVDRIYCSDDRFLNTVKSFIFGNGWWCKTSQAQGSTGITNGKESISNPTLKTEIPLLNWDKLKKPYMDTMKFFTEELKGDKISLYLNNNQKSWKEAWSSTDGGYGQNDSYVSILDKFAVLVKKFDVKLENIKYNSKKYSLVIGKKEYSVESTIEYNNNFKNYIKKNPKVLSEINFINYVDLNRFYIKNIKLVQSVYENRIRKTFLENNWYSKVYRDSFMFYLRYYYKESIPLLKKYLIKENIVLLNNKSENIKIIEQYLKKEQYSNLYVYFFINIDFKIIYKVFGTIIDQIVYDLLDDEILSIKLYQNIFKTKDRLEIFKKLYKYMDLNCFDVDDLTKKDRDKLLNSVRKNVSIEKFNRKTYYISEV